MRGKRLVTARLEERSMKQLETRFYSLDELAKEIGRKRDGHFAERAKNDLTKWGYQWEWINRIGVKIHQKPETAEARLAEFMNRYFGLDIQIDVRNFACFLLLMMTYDDFRHMPWPERAYVVWEQYDLDITEKTLRNWASKLLQNDVLHKDTTERQYWRTFKVNDETFREPIDAETDEEFARYKSRRRELIDEYMRLGLSKKEAWSLAFKQLWRAFGCCYYACPQFTINLIAEETEELLQLVSAVCAGE